MALKFGESKGSAIKTSVKGYKYVDGTNSIRIVGDILARYVYWIEGENGKAIPFECLAFDRDAEKFINKEHDWIKDYYPDLKCTWSYCTQGIVDGKLQMINLKKKFWEQVIEAADDLGDPTDPVNGWDLKIFRKKTGPLPFNVEYQLQALKCKTRALTADEMELIKDLKSMDVIMPRPTPDAQKELLDRIKGIDKDNQDDEALDAEFDVD